MSAPPPTRPPNLTTFCFVGFGTDRLRYEEAMKTAGRENPNRWRILSGNRAPGAGGQNRSCSIQWAAKQDKFRPLQECFFLTSTFIELHGTWPGGSNSGFAMAFHEVTAREIHRTTQTDLAIWMNQYGDLR